MYKSAETAVVPEPKKGSKIKSFSFVEHKTILFIKAIGNCAGCAVLSFELLLLPEVTLGIYQTSDGFLPKEFTLIFPFFFG